MAAIEQNTLKRRGIGLRACEPERAAAGFTLFAPHFVQNRSVYLIDPQGEVVHTWNLPYPPGLSGYLTERGTLFYNGRTSEESFLSPAQRVASTSVRHGLLGTWADTVETECCFACD